MKKVRILYILYHLVFPSTNRTCRYQPTCSQYALQAIEEYGLVKGSWLALLRITSCHPLSKRPLIDPLPAGLRLRDCSDSRSRQEFKL